MEPAAVDERHPLDYFAAAGTERGGQGPGEVWLLMIAAVALGVAIQARDGLFEPWAFVPLTIALAAVSAALFPAARRRATEWLSWVPLRWGFGAGAAVNFLQLLGYERPGSWHGPLADWRYRSLLAAGAALCAGIVFDRRRRGWYLVGAIAVYCLIGGRVIRQVPRPYMDVWILQTEGLRALAHGHNPYSASFKDVYGHPEMYAPAAIAPDGTVHQGYPYPPVAAWLELPGFLIGGDYRWACLAMVAATAALIATAGRSAWGPPAAVVFLFTPRAFFVIESGWTEPVTVFLLALTVWCAARRMPWWLTGAALGLFLSSKQYLVWCVPPVVLLAGARVEWRRVALLLVAAAIAGGVVSLPLILWDARAFWTSNVAIADKAGFRSDALSYLALLAHWTHRAPSALVATLVGFGAAIGATSLGCARAQRTPSGYALAVAVALLGFFAFYKFAFCNYYFLIIGAIGLAAATAGDAASADEDRDRRSRLYNEPGVA